MSAPNTPTDSLAVDMPAPAAQERVITGQARLDDKGVLALDEERRAAMVSNLLVVLVGDRDAQPVVNTGTPYT